ncbi:MAG: hypothetical protein IPM64_17785 [Phycisphaerales bacterium]|nr:hypothetical protein [Phycisphaerales bacterium]
MSYPHEGEIRRHLENWARWSPESYRASMWRDQIDMSGYRQAPIPIMGGEAGDTHAALARMDARERSALEQYHLRPGTLRVKARRLRISIATLSRRLKAAHHHFHELRWAVRHGAVRAGAENARIAKARASLETETGAERGAR